MYKTAAFKKKPPSLRIMFLCKVSCINFHLLHRFVFFFACIIVVVEGSAKKTNIDRVKVKIHCMIKKSISGGQQQKGSHFFFFFHFRGLAMNGWGKNGCLPYAKVFVPDPSFHPIFFFLKLGHVTSFYLSFLEGNAGCFSCHRLTPLIRML